MNLNFTINFTLCCMAIVALSVLYNLAEKIIDAVNDYKWEKLKLNKTAKEEVQKEAIEKIKWKLWQDIRTNTYNVTIEADDILTPYMIADKVVKQISAQRVKQ